MLSCLSPAGPWRIHRRMLSFMSVRGSGQASPQAAQTESEAKGGEPRTPLFRHPLDAPGPALPGTQAAEKAVGGCAFQRPRAGAVAVVLFCCFCCSCVFMCTVCVVVVFGVYGLAVMRKAQVHPLSAAHTPANLGTPAQAHLPSLFRASCHVACLAFCVLLAFFCPKLRSLEAVNSCNVWIGPCFCCTFVGLSRGPLDHQPFAKLKRQKPTVKVSS